MKNWSLQNHAGKNIGYTEIKIFLNTDNNMKLPWRKHYILIKIPYIIITSDVHANEGN